MVGSHVEPEWDETERAWMLALSEWREKHLCPLCGWPKSICQDPRNEGRFIAEGTRCYVTTAMRHAQEAARNPGDGVQASAHQDAVAWSAKPREDAVLDL